jgi:hypothetical protein
MKHELLTKPNYSEGDRFDYAARIITALVDLRPLTQLGPFIHAAQNAWKKTWKFGAPIQFCAGLNAHELGRAFEDLHRFPHHFDADFAKFDKSLEGHLLDLEAMAYDVAGISAYPAALAAFLAQRNNFASVKVKQIKTGSASWKDRRNSGDPNTTLGNTLINGVTWAFILEELGYAETEYVLKVNGDDSALGLAWVADDFVERATGLFLRLGLTIELNKRSSPWTLAFNGAHGYPAVDVDGSHIIVAGPQFGRFLPKVGWALDAQPDANAWIRGVAMGWKTIVAHIPPMKAIIDKMLELTHGVTAARVCIDNNLYRSGPTRPVRCRLGTFGVMLEALWREGCFRRLGKVDCGSSFELHMSLLRQIQSVKSFPVLFQSELLSALL